MADDDAQVIKLHEQADVGSRAEITLKELEGAFDALEKQCFDTFRNSKIHDDEGRTMCRLYLRVADDVKDRLESAVRNGEIARKKLITKKKPSLISAIKVV